MKARDIFGIVIRTIGIFILLLGLWYLVFAVAQVFGMPEETYGETMAYFTSGVPAVLLGILFLRYARKVVRFSYPGDRDDSEPI